MRAINQMISRLFLTIAVVIVTCTSSAAWAIEAVDGPNTLAQSRYSDDIAVGFLSGLKEPTECFEEFLAACDRDSDCGDWVDCLVLASGPILTCLTEILPGGYLDLISCLSGCMYTEAYCVADCAPAPCNSCVRPCYETLIECFSDCFQFYTQRLCGNGKIDPGEECDDGNTDNGDGCSSDCRVECESATAPSCGGLCVEPLAECVPADDGGACKCTSCRACEGDDYCPEDCYRSTDLDPDCECGPIDATAPVTAPETHCPPASDDKWTFYDIADNFFRLSCDGAGFCLRYSDTSDLKFGDVRVGHCWAECGVNVVSLKSSEAKCGKDPACFISSFWRSREAAAWEHRCANAEEQSAELLRRRQGENPQCCLSYGDWDKIDWITYEYDVQNNSLRVRHCWSTDGPGDLDGDGSETDGCEPIVFDLCNEPPLHLSPPSTSTTSSATLPGAAGAGVPVGKRAERLDTARTARPFIPCDNDDDGDCDGTDYVEMAASQGTCNGDDGYNVMADADHDGCVTQEDLEQLSPPTTTTTAGPTTTTVTTTTTTTTGTPSTTTTLCRPRGCDDGDPCSEDTCNPVTGCSNVYLLGFDRADCELGKLLAPALCGNDQVDKQLQRVIERKATKARTLLQKARSTAKPKKGNKFLKKCDNQLKVILKEIKKTAKKKKITEPCRVTLDDMIASVQPLVLGLRQ